MPAGAGDPPPRAEVTQTDPQTAGPWFAGYVDVTLKPAYDFEAPKTGAHRDVVLSHIVSSPVISCTPTWGALFALDEASAALDLDRVTARLNRALLACEDRAE